MTQPSRATRALALSAFMLLALAAGPPRTTRALAQALPRLELGDGLAVERCPQPPTAWEPPQCWQPVGFTFGGYGVLRLARTFARSAPSSTTRGRLFAVIPDNPSQLGRGHMAPVVFSDDLGAHWQEASWDPAVGSPTLGAFSPLAISIDPAGSRVVAVGEYARLWISNDGGASFTQRRSGGPTYVRVEVLGRAIVMIDSDGRAWSTPDDGSSLRRLSSDGGAEVSREASAIVVQVGRRTFRIDGRGVVR